MPGRCSQSGIDSRLRRRYPRWRTPCAIDANGARPLAAGRLPEQIGELVLRVKDFERITVEAALQGSRALAVDALTANPLVDRRELAEKLVDAYRRAHSPWLDYLT